MNRLTAAAAIALASIASAQPVIYATGQLLTPGDPTIPEDQPGHDDTRENFIYEIDVLTGVATPVSPVTTGQPSALAGTIDQRLLGFASGQLVEIDPVTGIRTNVGSSNGLSATAFDITSDGQGFILPFNGDFDTQQLFSVDLVTGVAAPIGSMTEIGDAIDTARGEALGTAAPFIISLGSVGNTLYGVDLDTDSLIALDSLTGAASVIGDVGAVGNANGGLFSGFSALTGVDENLDGTFDALYGSVNFQDDGDPDTPIERLGGVARFDLADGTWSLVGTNPGIIFFGFGSSPVPTPSAVIALATGGLIAGRRRR